MSTSALRSAYKKLTQRGRLTHDTNQAALIARLSRLQDELLATNNASPIIPSQQLVPPRGLYIYGSVGTGKSRMMDLFASTLPGPVSKRRVHFHEFMMDIHSRLHHARSLPTYSGDPLVQIGRTIRDESRVLCFDEFQVTDIADAMILSRLFRSIWREGGVMVSTSNRHPNSLYENGLNRDVVMPFIREVQTRCEVWEIGGKQDYRMRGSDDHKGGREEVFFTDFQRFEEKLSLSLKGRQLQDVPISVPGGRTLDVSATPSEIESERLHLVHGDFKDLCEASLGSTDYYTLCSKTNVIFVSGLRRFRTTERDFVRRFITLIDLAYEKKTKVICHSSVPLNEVFLDIMQSESKLATSMSVKGEGGASSSMMSTFIGETEWSATGLMEASLATGGAGETDVGFAIGRAISRLHEMGSADYGIRD